MNYYLWGQLFGKITSIVGIGSFASGLIFKKQKYLLTSIFLFSLIELFFTYIILGIEVKDKTLNLVLIVMGGLIAGYLPFIIKSFFIKEKKQSAQILKKTNQETKQTSWSSLKLAFYSFIIISLSIFALSFSEEYKILGIFIIWFYIIPVGALFFSVVSYFDWAFKTTAAERAKLQKKLSKDKIDYQKVFDDFFFKISEYFNNSKNKKMKKAKEKDIFWIAPIIVLVIALFPLPIGYYTLSRLVVSACALYYAIQFHKRNNTTYTWIYGFLVVLYNPIIPIYLYEKFIWVVVNLITIYIFYKNKKK